MSGRSKRRVATPVPEGSTEGKACTACKRWLHIESYSLNKLSKDGRAYHCCTCQARASRTALPQGSVIVYASEPLKRARYQPVMVNGRLMQKYVVE